MNLPLKQTSTYSGWPCVRDAKGKLIAEMHAGDDMDADAEFIVRACNSHYAMLEALENIENDNGSIPDSVWAMRNAAIAQAKETTNDQP